MTKVINLFGGPACGKSTAAAGLFNLLKQSDVSVEYVGEYAKDLIYEGTLSLLSNQVHIFSEQFRRQFRLLDKVDYIITDSPLLLSCVYFDKYNDKNLMYGPEYSDLTKKYFLETYRQFENTNFLINRPEDKYCTQGRIETLDEAVNLDLSIKAFLDNNQIVYTNTNQTLVISDVLEQVFSITKLA